MGTKDIDLKPRERRDSSIFVRVTEEEAKTVAQAAANAGMTLSDFARYAIRLLILEQEKSRKR